MQNDPLPALESHLREHGRLLVPGSRKDYMLLYLTRIVLALARSNRHWYSEYVRLTTEEE